MTETDFLHAILESPGDEVARLAFADWLQERGDPDSTARGEFIQVQIQLSRHTEGGNHPSNWIDPANVPQLRSREQELLALHGEKWAKPIAKLVDKYQFHNGFIESITLDLSQLARTAEILFAHTPLRRVRLTGAPNAQLVNCTFLERLNGLDFSRGQWGDPGLATLLSSRYLGNITWLDLSYCYLTDRGAQQLAQSSLFGHLSHLNLSYNFLGIPGVQALFASPRWGKIRHLVLTGNQMIDSRVNQLLTQRLQDKFDPSLLRSMLQTHSREEREYTNRSVRELAQRAGREPARAAAILGTGLRHGNRKVRSAAAQMLAQLGTQGTCAVPQLVQRLFESNKLVTDHVAPALARLLPELHPEMQRWLCLLANPLLPATANLRDTLKHPRLPEEIRLAFALICTRRLLWWSRLARKDTGPARLPEPGNDKPNAHDLRTMTTELLDNAGQHAGRHHRGKRRDEEVSRGAVKEAAWLLARLTELLLACYPAPESKPAPPAGMRGRRR